jgi:hypothetical protein
MGEKANHYIIGIHISNRVKNVLSVQNVLTEFGCHIKTRLGLHELSDSSCSPNGLLIIELLGEDGKAEEFVKALKEVEGVDVQKMIFTHD